MGNLLGAPITEKETHTGKTTQGLAFGLSSMQGWRIHMEDSHICQTEIYAEQEVTNGDNENMGDSTIKNNEVKKILLKDTSLFAVFDGHAGSFAAKFSAENYVQVLSREPLFVKYAERMQDYDTAQNLSTEEQHARDRELLELLEEALARSFLEFDKILFTKILSTASRDDGDATEDSTMGEYTETLTDDSGTTAVIVLLTPKWIVCANAGDSRAIYSKSNGRTIPLSYDHKPDDEEEERRIVEAGGCVRAGRVDGDLAVSRGFGDFRFKLNNTKNQLEQKVSCLPDIIIQNRNNEEDEFIVLACDGVWDIATNKECSNMVQDIFQEGEKDLGLACEEILDLSLKKGSKDNISALIVELPGLKYGSGGGVTARREKLAEEVAAAERALQQQQGEENNS